MSRNLKLLIGLVSAAGFYYLFGVALLRSPGNEAYLSIVPAIRIVVIVITMALIALTVREYRRSGSSSGRASNSDSETRARNFIRAAWGKQGHEQDVTLFVSHHLAELDSSYWVKHTGNGKPTAQQVLDILEIRVDPDDEENMLLDFALPGDVSHYVLSVELDESGGIVGIAMES
ncbi:MAG: DUF2004 domain-containing protein [Woeseiaceae bacterium]|nr:DUF2004 domain-containing protein [Woeseiaceae bacterium]